MLIGACCTRTLAIRCCADPRGRRCQVSCAGNGLIVSTLGAVLAAHSGTDPETGGPVIEVLAGVFVNTATFNGLLLGTRWGLEGLGAPLIGRSIDRLGHDNDFDIVADHFSHLFPAHPPPTSPPSHHACMCDMLYRVPTRTTIGC